MWKKLILLGALGLISAVLFGSPASAQATRTWVSGVGDDANPCSRTAPCKTWAGAISKTTAGGEIDALDPAGFGALTITKSITLDGGGGQVASALVSGTNGINVAAGASDIVVIKNIRFQGLAGNGSGCPGACGLSGINYTAGAELIVDNCDIIGFASNGINISLTTSGFAVVRNSTFRDIAGSAIFATSTSGYALVQVVHSGFHGVSSPGIQNGTGVNAGTGGGMEVNDSEFQDLSKGASALGNGILNIENSFFTGNVTGISTAAGTTLNVANNGFYNNGTAFSVAGTAASAGNNRIGGTLGTFTPTPITQK